MPQKNVFHKKINKKVNKKNIRNSEDWLLDDVSEILNLKNYIVLTPAVSANQLERTKYHSDYGK